MIEVSGDIRSSSIQSTLPQNPDNNLQSLPKKMLISDIDPGAAVAASTD